MRDVLPRVIHRQQCDLSLTEQEKRQKATPEEYDFSLSLELARHRLGRSRCNSLVTDAAQAERAKLVTGGAAIRVY